MAIDDRDASVRVTIWTSMKIWYRKTTEIMYGGIREQERRLPKTIRGEGRENDAQHRQWQLQRLLGVSVRRAVAPPRQKPKSGEKCRRELGLLAPRRACSRCSRSAAPEGRRASRSYCQDRLCRADWRGHRVRQSRPQGTGRERSEEVAIGKKRGNSISRAA